MLFRNIALIFSLERPCYLENRVVREPCKRRSACTLILAAQTKFNLSHVNKIESPHHGIMGKKLHPINSAPPNSKTEVILLFVDKVYDCMCELREACVNQ